MPLVGEQPRRDLAKHDVAFEGCVTSSEVLAMNVGELLVLQVQRLSTEELFEASSNRNDSIADLENDSRATAVDW